MFCPLCRAEYRDGFIRCHDCKLLLVSSREEKKGGRVSVWRGSTQQHLDQVLSTLGGARIPYHYEEGIAPLANEVWVLGEDAVRAESAIRSLDSSEPPDQPETITPGPICPRCHAHYREGFIRCSDCGVDLVPQLLPEHEKQPELDIDNRPDLAKGWKFGIWFLPMCLELFCGFATIASPAPIKNPYFEFLMVCLAITSNFGCYWMLYQAIRYERRVGRYVVLSFVPFMFLWYVFVRLPLRKPLKGDSEFIR